MSQYILKDPSHAKYVMATKDLNKKSVTES